MDKSRQISIEKQSWKQTLLFGAYVLYNFLTECLETNPDSFLSTKAAFGRFCAISAGDEQQLRTCNQNNPLKNLQFKISDELKMATLSIVWGTAYRGTQK